MEETFSGRFEQGPREKLSDEVSRLKRWIREASPTEVLENVIIDLDKALADARERKDFDVAEVEGTIARLKNEARIKDDGQVIKVPVKRINRIEGGEGGSEKKGSTEV